MKCPTCAIDLVMSERQGIEIDYCPTCRGVWLDRGELDKIIERSAGAYPPSPAVPVAAAAPQQVAQLPQQPAPYYAKHGKDHHDDDHDHHGWGKQGKRSFLKDLFD